MNFLKYLDQSGMNEDITKFRAMNIRLVDKEKTENKKIVRKITQLYDLSEENNPIRLVDELNKELKRHYKGKFMFDFVLEEGKNIEEIKIKRNKKRLKILAMEFNDSLAKIKKKIERKLKKEHLQLS